MPGYEQSLAARKQDQVSRETVDDRDPRQCIVVEEISDGDRAFKIRGMAELGRSSWRLEISY